MVVGDIIRPVHTVMSLALNHIPCRPHSDTAFFVSPHEQKQWHSCRWYAHLTMNLHVYVGTKCVIMMCPVVGFVFCTHHPCACVLHIIFVPLQPYHAPSNPLVLTSLTVGFASWNSFFLRPITNPDELNPSCLMCHVCGGMAILDLDEPIDPA